MSYLGDRAVGSTVVFDASFSINGVPTDFASTPTVSVYKGGSTTETTSGVTVTQPYDGRAGLMHVVVDTSADGSFYADENDFSVVITTGTISGINVADYVIGSFSLSTQRRILDKTVRAMGRGVCTSGGSTTSVPTSSFIPAGAAGDQFKGRIILFDADTTTVELRGQAASITGSSNDAAPTFTVSALSDPPSSGDTFSVV